MNEANGPDLVEYNYNPLGYIYGNVRVGFATTLLSSNCGPSGTGGDTVYTYLIWTKPDQTVVYLSDTTYNGQPKSITATPSGVPAF